MISFIEVLNICFPIGVGIYLLRKNQKSKNRIFLGIISMLFEIYNIATLLIPKWLKAHENMDMIITIFLITATTVSGFIFLYSKIINYKERN
jgi:hypothetical protein